MYDWYLEYFKKETPTNTVWPVVLDADDIMTSPELVRHYAALIGMDPTRLKFSWAPATQIEAASLAMRESLVSILTTTINASAGVMKEKAWAGLDLDIKVREWRE